MIQPERKIRDNDYNGRYFHEHGFVHKEKKLFQQMSKDDSRTTDVFRSVFRRYANIIVSND